MCTISFKFKQMRCKKNQAQLLAALIALFHFLLQCLNIANSVEQIIMRNVQLSIIGRATKQLSPKLLSGSLVIESTTHFACLQPSAILWQIVEIICKLDIEDAMIGIKSSISASRRLCRGSNGDNKVCRSHPSFFGRSFG